MKPYVERYGPWAVVAGASEGLGAEFARQLAERGLSLVLVARRGDVLEDLAGGLRARYGVEVRIAPMDLARADLLDAVRAATEGLDVGLVVYNAAYSLVSSFLDQKLEDQLRTVDVNCRGPLVMAHHFAKAMVARGRGGIILMSSLSAFQGAPTIAAYAATKAYNLVLAESLWGELKSHGVDVLACCAGATRTPGYQRTSKRDAPGTMEPAPVVTDALDALGARPSTVPGAFNRAVTVLMTRVLPRRVAIKMFGDATRSMARLPS